MRAILLGQDRYRRRYMALPHLGAVLVEGPEDLLSESKAASTLHLYLVHTAAEFSKTEIGRSTAGSVLVAKLHGFRNDDVIIHGRLLIGCFLPRLPEV